MLLTSTKATGCMDTFKDKQQLEICTTAATPRGRCGSTQRSAEQDGMGSLGGQWKATEEKEGDYSNMLNLGLSSPVGVPLALPGGAQRRHRDRLRWDDPGSPRAIRASDRSWAVFSSTEERAREARDSADASCTCAEKKVVVKDYRDGFFPFLGGQIKEDFEALKRSSTPIWSSLTTATTGIRTTA